MLLGHKGGNDPEEDAGPKRAGGHISHRSDPLVEQEFGDRDTQSEDGVGKEDGTMRLELFVHWILNIDDCTFLWVQNYYFFWYVQKKCVSL